MAQALIKGRLGTQGIDPSSDWLYTINDTVTHIEEYIGTKTAIVIPARIAQRPTQLYATAFQQGYSIYPSQIKSITIPNGVNFVNNDASWAFAGCTNVSSINIPQGTVNLRGAFSGSSIGKFGEYDYEVGMSSIPYGVTDMSEAFSYTNGDHTGHYRDFSCSYMKNYYDFIPNTVTNVAGMFDSASVTDRLPNIPDSVIDMSSFFTGGTSYYSPVTFPQKIGNSVQNMESSFSYSGFVPTRTITLPSSVRNLYGAFQGSSMWGDASIYLYGPNVTNIESAFDQVDMSCGYYPLNLDLHLTNSNLKSLNNLCGYGEYCGLQNVNIYAPYATEMNHSFYGHYSRELNINAIPYNIVNMVGAFQGSRIKNSRIDIPPKVINMSYAFYSSTVNTATFGSNVQDASYAYSYCPLEKIEEIPYNVTNLAGTFEACHGFSGDVIIRSGSVQNMKYCFAGTYSWPKAVYVPSYTTSWDTAMAQVDGIDGVTVYPLEDLDSSTFNTQFEYYLTDEEAVITNYIGTNGHATIPSRFQGRNVVLSPSRYLLYYEYDYETEQIEGPFINKKSLISVRMSPNVKVMGGDMSYMFYNCSNLTSVPVFPKYVTNTAYTFYNCQKLTNVSNQIGNVVNGAYMFWHCTGIGGRFSLSSSLTNCTHMFGYAGGGINYLEIPYGITNIHHLAYQGKMTCNISIPSTVTDASYAFHNCPITNVSISNGVTNLYYAFAGTGLINAPAIPDSVVNLSQTFSNCQQLVNGPSSIGNNVNSMTATFSNCFSLQKICNIPNSVVYCNSIFQNCTSLNTRINFGTGVQYMTYAFRYATAFTNSVYIYSREVKNCYNMFYNTSANKTVYVYSGSNTNTTIRTSSMYTNGRNGVTVSYI